MRATLGMAGCLLALLISLPAHGSTVALKYLTPQQAAALDASEQRLGQFDRALQVLDERRAYRKISRLDYQLQQHELVGFIANEAEFQNAILSKDAAEIGLLSDKQLDALKTAASFVGTAAVRVGMAFLTAAHP